MSATIYQLAHRERSFRFALAFSLSPFSPHPSVSAWPYHWHEYHIRRRPWPLQSGREERKHFRASIILKLLRGPSSKRRPSIRSTSIPTPSHFPPPPPPPLVPPSRSWLPPPFYLSLSDQCSADRHDSNTNTARSLHRTRAGRVICGLASWSGRRAMRDKIFELDPERPHQEHPIPSGKLTFRGGGI
ncbi:hypothetical protein F5148DRAFT_1224500, partial [Russula earlei]